MALEFTLRKNLKQFSKTFACLCVCMCDIKYSYLEYKKKCNTTSGQSVDLSLKPLQSG